MQDDPYNQSKYCVLPNNTKIIYSPLVGIVLPLSKVKLNEMFVVLKRPESEELREYNTRQEAKDHGALTLGQSVSVLH